MSDAHSTYLEDPRLNGKQGFAASIVEYLEARAGLREAAVGVPTGGQKGNIDALERLAYYLPELDEIRDRRFAILADVNTAYADLRRVKILGEMGSLSPGEIGTDPKKFEKPTYMQSWILSTLGDALHPAPPPDQTLTDLTAAGVRDLLGELGRLTGRERQKAVGLADQLAEVTAELEQNRADVDALRNTRTELESVTAQLAEKDKLIEELRRIAAVEPKKPRRKMIEPAIYRAASGGLEVAEPTGKGKTKYHPADSLGAARLLREELRSDQPAEPTEADLEAALDAKEAELGHELTEEEIGAVRDELANSTAADEVATEEVS